MAEFNPAYQKTNGNEGGYANNPADSGGETYKGVARKSWPQWPGWRLVDGVKALTTVQPGYGSSAYRNWVKFIDGKLAELQQLQQAVRDFYRKNFWNNYCLGEITSQPVAEWVYDHVVNAGARGAMWIQLAAKVTPDGGIGAKSLEAINAADPAELLTRVEDIAGAFRLDRAHANPSQIQFLTSWLRRDGQPESIIAMVKKAAADGCLDDSEVALLKAEMEKVV